jgi:hypothetical protein
MRPALTRIASNIAFSFGFLILLATPCPSRGQKMHPVAFSRPASDFAPIARPIISPGSFAISPSRSPNRNRASFWRIEAQVFGGAIGAVVGGFIAYNAFGNGSDRRVKGDESYSPNGNTAYALGSFVGSTAAVQLIGMGDGSRAPVLSTAIGTGIVTVPMLALRQEPLLPLIGVIFGAPLQGLFGTVAYQVSRRAPPSGEVLQREN